MLIARKTRTALRVFREGGWTGLRRAVAQSLYRENARSHEAYRQEANALVSWFDFSTAEAEASRQIHRLYAGSMDIRSVSWFIPDFNHPYYGGIHTILRFAQYFQDQKGLATQLVVVGGMARRQVVDLVTRAFPTLSKATVNIVGAREGLDQLSETDASVATLWWTAYSLLKFNRTKRKFCFLQDYEPLFYPAGSSYGLAEATYRFGFYGIANTPSLKAIYEEQPGNVAECFVPCVDTEVFWPGGDRTDSRPDPYTVFFYGRPETPRNGFELGAAALRKLKERMGDGVRIVSAGANWSPRDFDLEGVIENLGLLGYEQTAELYRTCVAGLVMMFTRHPSYLPFELMASGCLVVTNYNPATTWLLKDGENCLLSEPSVSCLVDTLERALLDSQERERITANAVREVRGSYSDWTREMDKVLRFMRNPLGR